MSFRISLPGKSRLASRAEDRLGRDDAAVATTVEVEEGVESVEESSCGCGC